MKLNIGCGKQYKVGFINIDAYDATVADMIMSAHALAYPSNTVEEIEVKQLIEHLGYVCTRYALAEWFRVLKPGGTLCIETPDIERSFQEYLKGNHETKKELLPWIFGVDSPGMTHRLCFPEVLLEDFLKKTGFTALKKSFVMQQNKNPTLQIRCKKPKNCLAFQILACCRKRITNEKIVITEPNSVALEQEQLLDFVVTQLHRYQKKKEFKIIDDLAIETVIKSPKITQILLEECINQQFISKKSGKKILEAINFFIAINISGLLLCILRESPCIPGTQHQTIKTVVTLGKQSVRDVISGGKKGAAVKTSLMKLSRQYKINEQIFFSEKTIEYTAAQLAYRGIKEFSNGNISDAITRFNEAILYDRNNLLYYWNMGRLLVLKHDLPQAKKMYDAALFLIQMNHFPQQKKLETVLRKEQKELSSKNCKEPIIDVSL
jgi:predicted SAM-dependent methyltransferase/tetratricopeptide (TPR) repeat protein